MKRLLIFVLLLFSTPLQAAEPFFFYKGSELWSMPMPDDYWFDRPALAPISVTSMPKAKVAEICSKAVGKYEDSACALMVQPYYCAIYIEDGLPKDQYDATLWHEIAHCHGWPADHP